MLDKSLSFSAVNNSEIKRSRRMNLRAKIISGVLFITFFIAGWYFGISQIKQSILTSMENTAKIKNSTSAMPPVSVPSGYISDAQYKLDVLHYK